MQVTTNPNLTGVEKAQLKIWLIRLLASERLESDAYYPLPDTRLCLYVDSMKLDVYRGNWQIESTYLYVGGPHTRVEMRNRLAILGGLVQLCDPSGELSSAVSQAVTRYLLGEYRELSSSLISAAVPPTGIAFSDDGRVASLLGEEWMLPSGEIVDVTGWNVCATVLPASELSAVEAPLDREFPVAAANGFAVGQRVRWTPRVERDPSFHTGDGVITGQERDYWMMDLDESQMGVTDIFAETEDLSHI